MTTRKTLHFSVDAQLLDELGKRLVSQDHIALAELIKNSYDADATQVEIRFRLSEDGAPQRITIQDDGCGMSLSQYDLRSEPSAAGELYQGKATAFVGSLRDAGSEDQGLWDLPVLLISAHFGDPGRRWDYFDLDSYDGIFTLGDFEERAFAQRLIHEGREYGRARALWQEGHREPFAVRASRLVGVADLPSRADFLAALALLGRSSRAVPVVSEPGVLRVIRFIRQVLQTTPGPLLSLPWAAVTVGMTLAAFRRREKLFAAARYRGIFSGGPPGERGPRWWWRQGLEAEVVRRAKGATSAPSIALLAGKVFALRDSEVAWCSVGRAHRRAEVAEVLALPEGVSPGSPGSDSLMTPIARANAILDGIEDPPPPFLRVFRYRVGEAAPTRART